MSKQNTLVLIDGNSLVNRAFYALPPLTNSLGLPTNAVYGFLTMLIKVIDNYSPTHLAVVFDLPKPTFRHKKYKEYKATRKKMPEELVVQMPLLKQMLTTFGIYIVEKEGFEADDIIGTLSTLDTKTFIITGDKDALSLITDSTTVLITRKGLSEIVEYTKEFLYRELRLTPSQIVDYKALRGDTSDNIPGVKGVGEKTALDLLESYKTLDGIYNSINEIKGKLKEKLVEDKENAYLSRELATIVTDINLGIKLDSLTFELPFSNDSKQFLFDNNFKSVLKREDLFLHSGRKEETNIKATKKEVSTTSIKTLAELEKVLTTNNAKQISFYFKDDVRFSFDESREYAIKLSQTLLDDGINFADVIAAFKKIFSDHSIKKILFDVKFLKKQLASYGVIVNNFFDVKLAQYLVENSKTLDTLENFSQAEFNESVNLGCNLICLHDKLLKELEEKRLTSLYFDIELPLVDILYNMEKSGFKIDKSKLSSLGVEYSTLIEKLSSEIQTLAKVNFNVNSPKQLSKVLFEDLKLPYPKRDKKFSTNAEVLEMLESDYPIVKKMLEYRKLAKLNSTYVEGLLRLSTSFGFVHTEFRQALTATGRLSSVEPNLQNIPVLDEYGRNLRKVFIPSISGNVLISADYSQIELRILAHLSKDPLMLKAFKNGDDIHTTTAAQVFGVSKEAVTKEMRRTAKAVNFGIIYGMSDFGLAKTIGVNRFKAKEYIDLYFKHFKGVKDYLDSAVLFAKKNGFIKTLFGRVRYIPELLSPNAQLKAFGERVAMNMPCQGGAADIIKIAMLKVDKAIKNTSAKILLQVHDELIVEADKKESKRIAEIVKHEMESAAALDSKLVVNLGIGESWYDCK